MIIKDFICFQWIYYKILGLEMMENYNSNFYISHNQINFPSINDPFYKYQNDGYM
jgi:hypothetical protein